MPRALSAKPRPRAPQPTRPTNEKAAKRVKEKQHGLHGLTARRGDRDESGGRNGNHVALCTATGQEWATHLGDTVCSRVADSVVQTPTQRERKRKRERKK